MIEEKSETNFFRIKWSLLMQATSMRAGFDDTRLLTAL